MRKKDRELQKRQENENGRKRQKICKNQKKDGEEERITKQDKREQEITI